MAVKLAEDTLGLKFFPPSIFSFEFFPRWGPLHRNGDEVFVDIETEIECNRFYGVVVSSYSRDESERISRLLGADVLAALPTRATRDPNERQPHRLNQPCNPRPTVARQP